MSDEKPKVQKAEVHIEHVIYAQRALEGETNLSGGECLDLVEVAKIHKRADAEKLVEFLRGMGFKVSLSRHSAAPVSSDFSEEEEEGAK